MTQLTGHVSQRAALRLVGLAASSWHYRHHPRPAVDAPVAQADRAYPSRLTDIETARIVALLEAGFAAGKSVYTSWFDALDAGDPVASQRTWYRIAHVWLEASRPVRRRKHRRASSMPQFDATGPNQVWCWDITKVPGPYVGTSYDLYAIIDAFSRYIIEWRIEPVEKDSLALDMFDHAISQHAVPRLVHSDGGPSMTSKTLTGFYRHHGITISRNRPRVSNDNPFIESWFKTAKYRPDYPKWFRDIDHARTWAATAIADYNQHHHHSSLEGHTPDAVHHGTWPAVHRRRQATLEQLAATNPSRWRRQPHLETPYATVSLNMKPNPQRLQTA